MIVKWFCDRWWVWIHGSPYRWATADEVFMWAEEYQYG